MAQKPGMSSAILLGTVQRASLYSSLTSVDVADTPVQLVQNIKLLGIILNSNFTMWEHNKHVSHLCITIGAFFHIHGVLNKSTVADIAAALVSSRSRLDYAISILYDSPSSVLFGLQGMTRCFRDCLGR